GGGRPRDRGVGANRGRAAPAPLPDGPGDVAGDARDHGRPLRRRRGAGEPRGRARSAGARRATHYAPRDSDVRPPLSPGSSRPAPRTVAASRRRTRPDARTLLPCVLVERDGPQGRSTARPFRAGEGGLSAAPRRGLGGL